jgi:catechol 2,3-dioxygenase-like lactoylglutathione lyase family enzyme
MKFLKIDSVTLPVKDHAKTASWYADTLGLDEIWRMDDRKGVGFGVGDNSATINLFAGQRAAQLIIQVDRVEDARRDLESRGVHFEGPTETLEGIGRFAGFTDPDGNRIALLDYTIEHGEASA